MANEDDDNNVVKINFDLKKDSILKNYKIDITSISGIGRLGNGDHKLDIDFPFKDIKLHVTKKEFGFSSKVRKSVKNNIFDFNWILVPAEKKNFLLILYVYFLKVKIKCLKILCIYMSVSCVWFVYQNAKLVQTIKTFQPN